MAQVAVLAGNLQGNIQSKNMSAKYGNFQANMSKE